MATSAAAPTNVSLRIIILAQGSNREDDLHLVVPLDMTVIELKERLQALITGQPQQDQQRLIYHGRPLLENSATLRSILRLQAADQTVHVLHLVIRPDATANPIPHQSVAQPVHHMASPPPPPLQHAQQGIQQPQFPHIPGVFQPMLNPAHLAEQANMFQQHMAMHNQHLANLQQGLPPHLNFGTTHQIPGGNAVPAINIAAPHHGLPRMPGNEPHTGGNAQVPHNTHGPQQSSMTMRIQESIGPNGERIRVVTNSTTPTLHNSLHAGLNTNPVERSASAPGFADRAGTPVNPIRHRPNPASQIPSISPHGPILLPGPVPNPLLSQHQAPAHTNTTVWLLSSPSGPQALLFAPGHGYYSTATVSPPSVPDLHTSSNSDNNRTSHGSARATSRPRSQNPPPAEQAQAGADIVGNRPGQAVIVRQEGQPPAAGNAPARPQNAEAGEIAAFVLQRGWLFLRLYMFIFVLSEPGTWRRIILLGLATLACFLPRQNPFTEAFHMVRRYFDDIIGPPQLLPRPPRQPIQQPAVEQPGNVDQARHVEIEQNANQRQVGRRAMPSPEAHARRLLRDHQAQQPNFLRAFFYPVEHAITLFLASLIPGVGERHVQAREEARRIVAEGERQEEAERQAESRQASSPPPDTSTDETDSAKIEPSASSSNAAATAVTTGSASGVETTSSTTVASASGSDEGIRHRDTTVTRQAVNGANN